MNEKNWIIVAAVGLGLVMSGCTVRAKMTPNAAHHHDATPPPAKKPHKHSDHHRRHHPPPPKAR